MTAYSYTVGASGADYTTLALAVSARQTTAVDGDTIEFVLLDSTATAATFLNFDPGITITVRSNNKYNGKWSGGTKITSPDHGLRFLGASNDNATAWQRIVIQDLWFDSNDFGAFYEPMAFTQANTKRQEVTIRDCALRYVKTNVRGWRLYGSHAGVDNTLLLENVVFWDVRNTNGLRIENQSSATSSWVITQKRCTYYDSSVYLYREANMDVTFSAEACIFKPYSTQAEIHVANSGGALTLNSKKCAYSRSQTDVEGLWDVNDSDLYAVTMVTGNPASGQIGFLDITTGDFELYDDVDNVAIDGASGVTGLPTEDIAGDPVDADPDIGAFEVQATGTTVTPGAASLALTAFAPTVTVTEHVTVVPGFGELTLTPHAPTVTATDHQVVEPGAAGLTLTPHAPTVTVTNHQVVEPGAAALTLTTYAPVVTAGDNKIVEPGAASLTLTPYAPTVVTTGDLTVVPGYGELMLVAFAPTIFVGDDIAVEPGAATLTLIAYPPAIATEPVAVVTLASWSTRDIIEAGDEWRLVLTGPSADAPRVRILLRFQKP